MIVRQAPRRARSVSNPYISGVVIRNPLQIVRARLHAWLYPEPELCAHCGEPVPCRRDRIAMGEDVDTFD